MICAALDLFGATFDVTACPCEPTAGKLKPEIQVCYDNITPAKLTALVDIAPVIPAGYQRRFVLTYGPNLVIENVSLNPTFNVTKTGTFRIHTLIYNPADLDLSTVIFGLTKATDISKLLIQQMVTSNPTPAYVGRISAVFRNNGQGVRGDLKAVVRAILLDPEARGNLKTDPNYGKLREPVLYVTNLLRPFNPTANNNITVPASCNGLSDGAINPVTQTVDQDVWNPPTVFNYYPMEYIIPNTPLAGPEFQIFSTGTALKRPNVINQFVPPNITGVGGINAVAGAASNTPCGTRIDITRLQNLVTADTTGVSLVDTLNRELMNGGMSANVRTEILNAVQAVTSTNTLKRARTALYLVTTSPQYQVQR